MRARIKALWVKVMISSGTEAVCKQMAPMVLPQPKNLRMFQRMSEIQLLATVSPPVTPSNKLHLNFKLRPLQLMSKIKMNNRMRNSRKNSPHQEI